MAAREKETAVTWAVNKIRHWHQEEGKTQEEIVPLLSEALVTKYHPDKSEEWMEEVFNEAAIVYAAIYRDEERAAARNDIKENLPPMDGSGRRRRGVTISRPDFVAEHVHLLDVLRHGSRAQQEAEASSQQRELRRETGGGAPIEAEKEYPRNYEPSVVEILEALSLTGDGSNIRVVGSASLRSIQFAADYDANEVSHAPIATIAQQLTRVIKRVKKIPGVIIGDIKCGEKGGEPIRWTPGAMEKGGAPLEAALRSGGRTKIDTIAQVQDGRYVEIGMVYFYGSSAKPIDDDVLIAQLKEGVDEELADKNYWKALKRLFSIARLKGETKRIERLTKIFNSDLGRLYSVISDISVLEYLIENGIGRQDVMSDEIAGFKSRLANIWTLPEFIEAEPGFDKTLDKAAAKPREALTMLRRVKGRFNDILQEEAKDILSREVSSSVKK